MDKFWRLLRLLPCLLLPLLALAQGRYEHPETGIQFPATLGAFTRTGVNRFPDSGLGVQITYIAEAQGKADIYLYTAGISGIADGIDSDAVSAAYVGADRDIHTLVAMGKYTDFKQLVPLGSVMRARDKGREWRIALYQFTPLRPGGEPMVSWLLVRGERLHFLKLRFSLRSERPDAGQAEISQFLEAFNAANPVRSSQAPEPVGPAL